MNINTKISKLYNKLDFLQDCDRWVQYRQVYKEITELERLRDEFGYSVAIRAEGHVTRRNRLNIQEVRSGLNKSNSIPKNL